MAPLLATRGSASSRGFGLAALLAGGSFESIATVSVGATSVSNIEFTNIPSTYTHLQIRYISRATEATSGANIILINLNGDTAGNYSVHTGYGNASVASSTNLTSYTGMTYFFGVRGGSTASTFGGGIIDILDYKDTNKYKTLKGLTGADVNGSGSIGITSGSWRNTSAITSIKMTPEVNNFAQYTTAALYGIKTA